jgi:hypothetical protein
VLQFERVVDAPAVVALVAARIGIAAVGALALDVAVGQELHGDRVVPLALHVFVDEAGLPVARKHLLGDFPMIGGVGVRVEVEGQPHRQTAGHEQAVILVDELAVGDAVGIGLEHDRRAVGVGAAHHQHVVADERW